MRQIAFGFDEGRSDHYKYATGYARGSVLWSCGLTVAIVSINGSVVTDIPSRCRNVCMSAVARLMFRGDWPHATAIKVLNYLSRIRLPAKCDRHWEVAMNVLARQVAIDLGDEDVDFLLPPSQPTCEQREAEAL